MDALKPDGAQGNLPSEIATAACNDDAIRLLPISFEQHLAIHGAIQIAALAAEARVAELTRERDEARAMLSHNIATHGQLMDDHETALARIKELETAEDRAARAAVTAVIPLEAMKMVGLARFGFGVEIRDGIECGVKAVREMARSIAGGTKPDAESAELKPSPNAETTHD